MDRIIKFFRERPVLSLILVFSLLINKLSLPNEDIDADNLLEITISNQKALRISGGDASTNSYLSKGEDFDLLLHIRLMRTFPDRQDRIKYQKKRGRVIQIVNKKTNSVKKT